MHPRPIHFMANANVRLSLLLFVRKQNASLWSSQVSYGMYQNTQIQSTALPSFTKLKEKPLQFLFL